MHLRVKLVGAKGAGLSSLSTRLQTYATHCKYDQHLDQLQCIFQGNDLIINERPEHNEHLRHFMFSIHIVMIIVDRTSSNFSAEVATEIKKLNSAEYTVVMLVATKSDAPNCCVTPEQVVQCAKDFNLSGSYLVSSTIDDSVRDLFRQSISLYYKFKDLRAEKRKPTIDYDDLITQLQQKLPGLQQDFENAWFGFRSDSIARKIKFLNELIFTLQDNPKLTIKEQMTIIGEKFEKELDSSDQNLLTNIAKKQYHELTKETLLSRQPSRFLYYFDLLPDDLLRNILSYDQGAPKKTI